MPQQAPYGDAFLVNTPSLDRLGERLYAEQKFREARQQQENQQLDASMQKEFGQIRSADVPEVVSNFQKYKAAKKDLLFNKQLHKDPIAYAKRQQEVNELLGNTYGIINGSKEEKKSYEQMAADKIKNPLLYDDTSNEKFLTRQKTPLSQLKAHPKYGDLTNPDNYIYKGTNTDFSKILTSAVGQPRQVYSEKKPVDKQGLQDEVTEYSFANTPLQVRDNILGSLSQHQAGRDASIMWKQIPDADKDAIDQAYAAIPKDKVVKSGLKDLPDLPTNTGNDAMDFANFQAKKYFLANEPKAGTPKRLTNEAVKENLAFGRQKQMEAIRFGHAKDLIELRKKIDPNDTEMQNLWVDQYKTQLIDEAKKGQLQIVTYKGSGGKNNVVGYRIPLDKTLSDALTVGKNSPDKVYVTPQGKILPVYIKYDDKGEKVKTSTGGFEVDEDLTRPISEEQLGVSLGKRNVTGKQRTQEIKSVLNKAGGTTKPSKKDDPLGLF